MHPLLPRVTCLSLLNQKLRKINKVKQLHAQLIINALKSPCNLGKLIQHFCEFSSPQATYHARLILHIHPNVYLLNVLLRCTSPRHAVELFTCYISSPAVCFDNFTYIFALGACARSCLLWEGKQIYARVMKHGFCSDVMVQTTAVNFYGKSQDIGSARKVFDEMSVRSRGTWNAMIAGYCSQRKRVGGDACGVGLSLFRDMLRGGLCGVKPDGTTMVSALSAVSKLGVLDSGICVHGYIEKMLYEPVNDVYVGTGLVDMYSKCGCVDNAMWIFERMEERNVLTWTAMTLGLAIHGRGKEALEVLNTMEGHGIVPNAVTFTSLLSACCHAGLVQEGLSLFYSMDRFGVVPTRQHYGCIVDLLGRAGHLEEAYNFIDNMQVERDAILWRTLLSACNVHGDLLTGEKVREVLLQMQTEQIIVPPGDVADTSQDYIALSNMYASADRWDDVKIVREEMKFKGYDTKPGLSSLQALNNFIMG